MLELANCVSICNDFGYFGAPEILLVLIMTLLFEMRVNNDILKKWLQNIKNET